MRFVFEGHDHDPLVVLQSRFWNFNAIGLYGGDEACVVDPGIYPADIDALTRALVDRGRARPRRVEHVVLTHSHHDHIRGWQRFPGARVRAPRAVAEKGPVARERILAAKSRVDDKLGIRDERFQYPQIDEAFDGSLRFQVGELDVELRFLPGHSDCTSVVIVPALATLFSADYLVSPGLPYCRFEARLFEQALETLARWCTEESIERVVPSHNDCLIGAEAIRTALDVERCYFRALRERVRAELENGASPEAATRSAGRYMSYRRAADLGGRERQDLDNARRVVAEEAV